MVKKPYPNDFWKAFDEAMSKAQNSHLWSDCQSNIDSIVSVYGLPTEAEEVIFTSYNDQFTLAMLHLNKACKKLK